MTLVDVDGDFWFNARITYKNSNDLYILYGNCISVKNETITTEQFFENQDILWIFYDNS